jgi:hypothetical protein
MTQKIADDLYCEICNYKCCKNSDFKKHLLTKKHNQKFNELLNYESDDENNIKNKKVYTCICGKIYKYRQGLSFHKKNCELIKEPKSEIDMNLTNVVNNEFIIDFLKQNQDFQKEMFTHMMEFMKSTTNIITNNNNINNGNINNNNHFNLQVFLNETCKDAMTLDDFVSSLKPTIYDLEETGRLGYSEGITRIIVNGLKELDITKRPIHCSDLKRETMFIKNNEKWEKETEEKPILLKAIKEVGKKNINNIKEWQKSNKNFNKYDSKQNDTYLQIVSNAMSGGTEAEQLANYEKIVKNIAKETIIEKNKKIC